VVSRPGAQSLGECLTEFGQIGAVAWYMGGDVPLTEVTGLTPSNFSNCVAACKADSGCQYVTYNYNNAKCFKKVAGSRWVPIAVGGLALVTSTRTACCCATLVCCCSPCSCHDGSTCLCSSVCLCQTSLFRPLADWQKPCCCVCMAYHAVLVASSVKEQPHACGTAEMLPA
jgi:hypothetical protein